MSDRFDTFSPPPAEPDPWETASPTEPDDDGGGELDPREAAALLEQTRRGAERRLEPRPPWLTVVAAAVVLVAYGVIWLSVRHEHPYTGPAGWALAALYGTIAAWAALVGVVTRRATSGVGGRAARQRRIEAATFATVWICVYVVQGALEHAGASKGIVYGIWPATGPLIVVGAAAAAYEAARGKVALAAFAAAAVVLGAIAAYTGPNAVWGVTGVGLCALILLGVLAQLGQRRA